MKGSQDQNTALWQRVLKARWLRLALGVLLSALSLYFALREITLRGVSQILMNANWIYLLLALGCTAVHHWAKAIRWQILLAPAQAAGLLKIKFRDILFSLLAGQMLNLIYPARVGDLSRVMFSSHNTAGRASAAGTIVMEKAVDMIAYSIMVICLAWFIAIPHWLAGSLLGLIGLLLAFWLLFILFVRRPVWIREFELRMLRWQSRWLDQSQAENLFQSFRTGLSGYEDLRTWRSSLQLAAWSGLAWGMALLTNYVIMLAVALPLTNWNDHLAAALLVLIGLQAGISVPAVPGRVGIFEYICVLALGVFGIEETAAFTYGVLLHLLVMLPVLAAGLVSLAFLGHNRVLHENELKVAR